MSNYLSVLVVSVSSFLFFSNIAASETLSLQDESSVVSTIEEAHIFGISVNSTGQLRFEVNTINHQYGLIVNVARLDKNSSAVNNQNYTTKSDAYEGGIFYRNYVASPKNFKSFVEALGTYMNGNSSYHSNYGGTVYSSNNKYSSAALGLFIGIEYPLTQQIAIDGKAGITYVNHTQENHNGTSITVPAAAIAVHYYW